MVRMKIQNKNKKFKLKKNEWTSGGMGWKAYDFFEIALNVKPLWLMYHCVSIVLKTNQKSACKSISHFEWDFAFQLHSTFESGYGWDLKCSICVKVNWQNFGENGFRLNIYVWVNHIAVLADVCVGFCITHTHYHGTYIHWFIGKCKIWLIKFQLPSIVRAFKLSCLWYIPDCDSLSSSKWSSLSNPFGQCLVYFSFRLQNLVGSKMFSTENANFLQAALSDSVFDVIDRVKSTGHTYKTNSRGKERG